MIGALIVQSVVDVLNDATEATVDDEADDDTAATALDCCETAADNIVDIDDDEDNDDDDDDAAAATAADDEAGGGCDGTASSPADALTADGWAFVRIVVVVVVGIVFVIAAVLMHSIISAKWTAELLLPPL